MVKTKKLLKTLISGSIVVNIATLGAALCQQKALAAFLSNYSGASSSDNATVVFTVWENGDGNWLDDLSFLNPNFRAGQSNGAERFVYLYQIYNTNPNPNNLDNLPLEQFSVATTTENGSPYLGNSLYSSGGFMAALDRILALPNVPQFPNGIPIDSAANDGIPSLITAVAYAPPFLPPPSEPPAFPTLDLNALVANPDLSAYANELTRAATFNFPDAIPAGVYSPILFLTSNELPSFIWAQTKAIGQGSPGDVSGINSASIPEPLTVCGVALAVGFGRLFKRQLLIGKNKIK